MQSLLPNFAFEEELHDPVHQPGRQTVRAIEDLAGTLLVLAGDGDQLVLPTGNRPVGRPMWWPDVEFVSAEQARGEPVPWGWSAAARRIFSERSECGPPQDAVRRVNSREFLAAFDRVLSPAAANDLCGRFCRDQSEWEAAIRALAPDGRRWCTKPQFSHAGRNRLLGSGTTLNDQQRGWLSKHLVAGVYVEPWFDVRREWSLHFEISPASSDVRLLGATELLNDEMGRYAGNLICLPEERAVPDEVLSAAEDLAAACAQAGYWGPLGLDGFLYADPRGNEGLRICNDINARYSMGRLALAARRLCNPAERGLWCQIRSSPSVPHKRLEEFSDPCETARKLFAASSLDDVNITRVTPLGMGRRPVVTTTVLLTGPDVKQLRRAHQRLQQPLDHAALEGR